MTATRLPVLTLGTCGRDPALLPRPVDDLDLDLLDRHRVGVDAEHARRLARRRAQPAGELGEVVGGVELVDRLLPVVAVDEVVPVGDQVAERAPVVAERDAAVHAPPGLGLRGLGREVLVDLLPVAQPHRHRPPRRQRPLPLQEPGRLAHRCDLARSRLAARPSIAWTAACARGRTRPTIHAVRVFERRRLSHDWLPSRAASSRSSSRPSDSACFMTVRTRL